jgi:hypothetical protein
VQVVTLQWRQGQTKVPQPLMQQQLLHLLLHLLHLLLKTCHVQIQMRSNQLKGKQQLSKALRPRHSPLQHKQLCLQQDLPMRSRQAADP